MEGNGTPAMVTIATYDKYTDAQRAVDALSDRKFPVDRLSIIAADLTVVERITGRKGYLVAVLGSGGSGALVGALLGWLFGLFSWVDPLVSALVLAVWGAVLGFVIAAVIGLIAHAATGGRRDFSSVQSMRAGRYLLNADPAVADEARAMLDELGLLHRQAPAGR
ncbi:MAG: general stress protein [Pseudonocardiaceae bacterium]